MKKPFRVADSRAERIVIKGENIRFPPKAALALGVVFNELATNAVKYGALSNQAGSILVEWTKEPAPEGAQLLLHWQEKDDPPVAMPSHTGFGSRVLGRGLTQELDAAVRLDYRPDGLACSMTIPITRGAQGG